jgi:hypothetical protein
MERPQTYVLERTAAGIGKLKNVMPIFILLHFKLASRLQKHGFFPCATVNLSWHKYFPFLALYPLSHFYGNSVPVFKVEDFIQCVMLFILNDRALLLSLKCLMELLYNLVLTFALRFFSDSLNPILYHNMTFGKRPVHRMELKLKLKLLVPQNNLAIS